MGELDQLKEVGGRRTMEKSAGVTEGCNDSNLNFPNTNLRLFSVQVVLILLIFALIPPSINPVCCIT